jgi:alpha-beta hydrolase superfamily lysophospholipase
MGKVFLDEFHDEFGTWPLAYIPAGGADYGELAAVAEAVGDGDDGAFYAAWIAAGDRLADEAKQREASGHEQSASDSYLRASVCYASAYHPIYGEPVDPRLLSAFRKQVAAFDAGIALTAGSPEPVRIPLEDTTMPAYLIPATGRETEVRPLVIFTNGYDATITDLYFASAVAATRRGYHALIFDGPGQGEMLYEQGVRLRPDWETVIGAVVDYAEQQGIVDPKRIALSGWSLGGHLAPRAASGEPRLAAVIADPPLWSMSSGIRGFAMKLGATAEQAESLGTLDDSVIDQMTEVISNDRKLRWSIMQRGFWVLGASDLRDFFAKAEAYTMEGRAEGIRCPTLFTMAESDPLAASAEPFFEAVQAPKTLLRFTAAEGADDHCEMFNRSLLNRRTLDWLDDTFEVLP